MALDRIVILGGGVTGLSAAYYSLRESPGTEVVLLESSERFGGQIRTAQREQFLLDLGPDGFLTREPAAIELCRSLGIEHDLISRNPGQRSAYIRRNAVLYRIPGTLKLFVPLDEAELAASGLLSPEGTQRVFMEPGIPSGSAGRDSNPAEESLADFFTRRFGREMYRYIAEPLAAGIFGGDGSRLSLQANFPELAQLEAMHGQVLSPLRDARSGVQLPVSVSEGTDVFRSFPGGMQVLTDGILRSLQAADRCRLLPGTTVLSVGRPDTGPKTWVIRTTDREPIYADVVVSALPAPESAKILSGLDKAISRDLAGITYSKTAAVFLGFRSREVSMLPSGSGYMVPRAENIPVLGCTWSSKKWSGRSSHDTELFRVFFAINHEATGESVEDEKLIERACRELGTTLGLNARPVLAEVYRWPRAITQYTVGHQARRARIESRLERFPNLRLAGSSLYGVGVPDCVRSARDAVRSALTAPV